MSSVDEATQTQIRNIETQTGQSLDELIAAGLATGQTKHKALQAFFTETYGLTYGNANVVAIFARDRLKGASGEEANFVDAQYEGKKAALRPLYDSLIEAITSFGDDVEVSPKRTYVSLRRKKQFAMLGPGTKGRLELGLNMKGVAATERLVAQPAGGMCQYKVFLTKKGEVDRELIGWIKTAFENAGS